MNSLDALLLVAFAHQARGNFPKGLGTVIIKSFQYSQRGRLTLGMKLLGEQS
jgi:hypothetical protein